MSPLPLGVACAVCLGVGLVDLAWLDANAARLAPPPDEAPLPAPAPRTNPIEPAPLPLTAATITRAAPAPALGPPTCVLSFATGESTVGDAEAARLAPVLRALARDPTATARIDGHADRRGAPAVNQAISARRAVEVAHWLERHGVDERRIVATGFGDARPIDDGTTEAALGRNRRVEIRIGHEIPRDEVR